MRHGGKRTYGALTDKHEFDEGERLALRFEVLEVIEQVNVLRNRRWQRGSHRRPVCALINHQSPSAS
jgi:hypothetical protein